MKAIAVDGLSRGRGRRKLRGSITHQPFKVAVTEADLCAVAVKFFSWWSHKHRCPTARTRGSLYRDVFSIQDTRSAAPSPVTSPVDVRVSRVSLSPAPAAYFHCGDHYCILPLTFLIADSFIVMFLVFVSHYTCINSRHTTYPGAHAHRAAHSFTVPRLLGSAERARYPPCYPRSPNTTCERGCRLRAMSFARGFRARCSLRKSP